MIQGGAAADRPITAAPRCASYGALMSPIADGRLRAGSQADGDDDGFISWQSGAAAAARHLSRRPATGVARRVQLVGRADEMKMRAADGMKKV